MPPLRKVGYSVQRSGEVIFEWQIMDFFLLSYGPFVSPAFSFAGSSWYLTLFPKETTVNLPAGWVDIYLIREDCSSAKTVYFTFGIKGTHGVEKKECKKGEFEIGYLGCGLSEHWSRAELRDRESTLMPNGVLTITCDVRTDAPISVQDSSTQTEGILEVATEIKQSLEKQDACTEVDHDLEDFTSSEKRGGEKALEDFGKGLASGKDSDITVKVGNAEIKVHKFVLSARSPVLEAMLRHDTEEKTSNSIKIEDCEPEDFKHYLEYLYTGSVQSLTEQNVLGLFGVADKYMADDLKQLCLERIRNGLSVQTFCDAVKLALLHGESDLLQLAINFATQNLSIIIRSVEWQNFICEYPKEANEILIKCIKS